MQQLLSQAFNVADLSVGPTLGTVTLTADGDLFVEIEIAMNSTGFNLDVYVKIDGDRVIMVPVSWPYMVQAGIVYFDTYRIRQNIGPVPSGAVVTVDVDADDEVAGQGTVRIWDTSVLSQLNEAMPSSRTANSPLDDLRRCRAFLANKTIQTLDTGVIVVKDNDGSTTLFTLTPTESSGDLTVTPS